MFRGGDYYDDPKFSNPSQVRNTMDISDINGTSSKSNNYKPIRDNINVSDINGSKPPLHSMSGQRSSNAYGAGIIDGQVQGRQSDLPMAGVRGRDRNTIGMSDILTTSQQQNAPQKIENRSLVTNDIMGAQAKRNYINNVDTIAGVRSGSPQRKNDSTVFSHLTDNYDRDALKRKDITSEITKPRNNMQNNVSSQNDYYAQDYLQQQLQNHQTYQQQQQQSQGLQMAGLLNNNISDSQQQYAGIKDYQQEKDDIEKQYQEYLMQKQKEAAVNYSQQLTQQPVNGLSGFTKNSVGSGNILAHIDISNTDVRSKNNFVSNGNQIFNNGGYSSSSVSRRNIQEQKFQQNFQKPMADRNQANNDFMNNNQLKSAAGVPLSMNSTKRISVNDGKERLFGSYGDENNALQRQGSLNQQDQVRTGKRILNSGGAMGILGNDSYSNVISGSSGSAQYTDNLKSQQVNQGYPQTRIVMMSHVPIPGVNYGVNDSNTDANIYSASAIPVQDGY